MGVAPGSPVSAGNTNPAFLDANGDDTGVGKYSLQNTDVASGAFITNIQALMNASRIATDSNETDFTQAVTYGAVANTILDGQNHRQALVALAAKFHEITGHNHDGSPGNGAPISVLNLVGVQLFGYPVSGTNLASVSGGSTDVSTQLAAAIPSPDQFTKGVVVNAPYNYVALFDSNDDSFLDGSGNKVYGRLTNTGGFGGTWTLTYFSDVSGTETPYSFPSPVTVKWVYQQLFDETDRPVYSELLVRSSDQVAGDIPDATTLVKGKVLLATATPQPVSATAAVGTGPRVAMEDHAHVGVHSVSKSGSAQLVGDVTFTGTGGVLLTQVGNNIDFATNPTGFVKNRRTFTLADNQPTPQLIQAYDKALVKSIMITYHIDRGTANYKTGSFIVNVNSDATLITYFDGLGSMDGDVGITLQADVAGGAGAEIEFTYTSTNTGTAGNIIFEESLIA